MHLCDCMSSRSWFGQGLRAWYAAGHRDLPWRRTRDPYRIWLSEVILQQTRVDQGTAYYERFIEAHPTVHSLAAAPDSEVMRLWQGLGYYSRARNLLAAARMVVNDHEGRFPDTVEGLRSLKGVGDYTAAAIASIAFDRPAAVVDGNVYRVLARAFGVDTPIDTTAGRREFARLALELLDTGHPGDHNQAVMELGATVCLPRKPLCDSCPLAQRCIARIQDRTGVLPVKAGRTKVRVRHFNYLVLGGREGLVVHQRTGRDIWQDLYQPPLVESKGPATRAEVEGAARTLLGRNAPVLTTRGPLKHILSHQVIHATFWTLDCPATPLPEGWVLADRRTLDRFAMPRLIGRFLEGHWTADLFNG